MKWKKRQVNPHLFRDAINTHRTDNGMQDPGLRSVLLNQAPSGINTKHYLKKYVKNDKSGMQRLKLYDQYFPY